MDDHACLCLLQDLVSQVAPGSSEHTLALSALAQVDTLIWRLPMNVGANDHPYTRNACDFEAVRQTIAQAVETLQAHLFPRLPDTRVIPPPGKMLPSRIQDRQALPAEPEERLPVGLIVDRPGRTT
jgi:hypothetical protein